MPGRIHRGDRRRRAGGRALHPARVHAFQIPARIGAPVARHPAREGVRPGRQGRRSRHEMRPGAQAAPHRGLCRLPAQAIASGEIYPGAGPRFLSRSADVIDRAGPQAGVGHGLGLHCGHGLGHYPRARAGLVGDRLPDERHGARRGRNSEAAGRAGRRRDRRGTGPIFRARRLEDDDPATQQADRPQL